MQHKSFFLLLFAFIGYALPQAQAQCKEGNCENGWGIYEYSIGDTYQGRYEGNFVEGKRSGKGKFVYANGDVYDGNWVDGKPKGYGSRIYKNGKIKSGEWNAGRLVRADKPRLTRECLVGNCKDGHGKSVDSGGNKYEGNFKNGMYDGYGEMKYASGDRYVGYFGKGVPNGKGSFYRTNGHVDTGEFFNGKPVKNKMKVWAVIVGVGDYQNFSKLKFTTKDAERVYAFMRSIEGGAVPENQIKLLLDEEATAFNIMNTAADLFEQADTNDQIMFYFAGHGKNSAFLPYDYDGDQGNLLYHGLVNSLLQDSPAKFKLCVVDACHSGSFDMNDMTMPYKEYLENYKESEGELASATRSTRSVRERIKDYYKSFEGVKSGLAVVMSSASEEISLEANKLKQGVFSYYFIQGLKGHANQKDENGLTDNVITVDELYKFIEKNVRNFTFGFQHPLVNGEYDALMPVTVLPTK
ncbi:MAG: peptidase C14 [Aureispira sp.]|nr:peptidase C14 [Aureispira sp.]